ncbi:hypothetical protein OfM1_14580 [Lactovum odontotermitis]
MKKSKSAASLALSVFTLGAAFPVQADTKGAPEDQVPVYRLYNKNTGEHFYTTGVEELINLQSVGWTSEGIGWYAPQTGEPVYRIYNPNAKGGDHYYTKSKFEAEHNVSLGWKWDNDGKPAFYSGGNVTNYVAYNPNAQSGAHNYTTSAYEQENILRAGWTYGAKAWQTVSEGTNTINLNQLMNQDPTTIQGLWKNAKGDVLKIIGKNFYVNGQDIGKGAVKNIWDNMLPANGKTATLLYNGGGTDSFAIEIFPKNVKGGEYDNSDTHRDRIGIGQTFGVTDDCFYRGG